ncbi:MAG: ABC-type nitrate/sulfonate/bicarbonate transport system substrate-binding protein [Marivirga sp.]|jgi:ABC-type nitrate/sulfonate/bicarbonate transport system substrate-binding protein
MEKLTIALDWTANTNHTGFFVALAKGFYKESNLEVTLRSPESDNYEKTPAKLLVEEQVEIAIAPSETVIAYSSRTDRPNLIAIAALLQKDASAIVSLKAGKIKTLKDLDGRKYASYDARFEDTIVQEMVKKAGGKGLHIKTTPEKLGIWNTLLTGEADATWVFMPWEGIMAKRKNIPLNSFTLDQSDIPYGYSPVLLARPDFLEGKDEVIKKFLAATAIGFQWAIDNPKEAAVILQDLGKHADLADLEFVQESQEAINPFYVNTKKQWGVMKEYRWKNFVTWLTTNKLLTKEEVDLVKKNTLYTNKYL